MTRHDYLDKLDANLSGRASDIQRHYQDMSAGYEAPTAQLTAYRGVDKRGNGRFGQTFDTPESLVARRFDQGWRTLTARHDGRIVGEIVKHPDTGHRTWWAES